MSHENNQPTTTQKQPDNPPPATEPPTPHRKWMYATIKTVQDFRIALIAHLKGTPTPFRPITNPNRRALEKKYGAELFEHASKIITLDDDGGKKKYMWLFKVGVLLAGFRNPIRNLRLITDRNVVEEYVFLECEPDDDGKARFMAKTCGEREVEEEERERWAEDSVD
ncbi:hypothetical protein EG327_011041 [Venturia inaequalis]|uniref:Uncharacterized protein n=1 Tax=Venturia inaequalis TaxID=5025 RepID=A0A8H3ZAJ0_VENIN|nr:hypothetical protein EG327_011041 [Venturia inaequalis]